MSRLRSAPAASGRAAGARTTPAGARGVYVQAPKSDIYVVMLAIALGAILLSSLLLLLEWNRYDFNIKATAMGPHAAPTVGLLAMVEKSEVFPTIRL